MAAPRKDNVKECILNATAALLENSGFSDISLAKIASEAGVSKGTLYYHYHSKGEILFELTDRYLEEQWDDFIRWTENKEKDTSLSRLVRYVIQRNTASAALRMQLLSEAQMGDEELRRRLVKRYGEFRRLISAKIAERTGFAPDFIARLLLLVSDGIIVQESLRNGDFDTEGFIEEAARLVKLLEDKNPGL